MAPFFVSARDEAAASLRHFFRSSGRPVSAPRATYRADIDGLRGLAILAVVVYHVDQNLLSGGFVGVDVFFVISGYLISRLLLQALDAGRFSWKDFYLRRVRRLVPALLVVLLAVLVAGWSILLRSEFKVLGADLASASAFLSNLAATRVGYFDRDASYQPLLHLWSLAVEEQFYLVWPALLFLTHRYRANQRLVIGLAIALSFVCNLILVAPHPRAAYYLLPGRLWELAAGALLVCWERRGSGPRWARWAPPPDLTAAFGLALIAGSAALLDSRKHQYPGLWALAPVAGAVALIAAGSVGTGSWLSRRVLGHRVLVFVGLISYPLYLWHWPVLALARTLRLDGLADAGTLPLVAASVLLAWLTYRFVERPLRATGSAAVQGALVGGLALVAAFGLVVRTGGLAPRLTGPQFDLLSAAADDWSYPGKSMVPFAFGRNTFFSMGDAKQRTLFFGDSNIEQYGPRIERLIAEAPRPLSGAVFATRKGCPPIPGVWARRNGPGRCEGFTDDALAFAADPSVNTIVIGAIWTSYFRSGSFWVDTGGSTQQLAAGTAAAAAAFQGLEAMIAGLRRNGKKVFVVLDIPTGPALSPAAMVDRLRGKRRDMADAGIDRAGMQRSIEPVIPRIRELAQRNGAVVIDPVDWLCGRDSCPVTAPGGDPIYMDEGHMRASFARNEVRYLDGVIAL